MSYMQTQQQRQSGGGGSGGRQYLPGVNYDQYEGGGSEKKQKRDWVSGGRQERGELLEDI